ncbi:unnamed protein product [Heterobilharzia americana]|nr:unnamed protein product [Heterobilharzia americana]
MRVPEKLSYDSDNSGTLSEVNDVSFRNYPVADLILDAKRPSEHTPGYSPDILNNSDIRSKFSCNAQAHASSQANEEGSAKAQASAAASCETSSHQVQERVRISKPSCSTIATNEYMSAVELRLSRLERRISHLEFQQVLIKSGLTIYILYRIMRWIIRNT